MEAGDKQGIATILKQYKLQGGIVNFPALFTIPSSGRITELAKNDFRRANILIIGALTMAFESMNLKRGMNEMQILDLSEAIIDSAEDDNLSFEDVVLFLQNMVRGKYEMSYESLDIPKFMKLFDLYRTERHKAIMEYRENQHLQFKGLGSAERSNQADPLSEHFSRMADTLSTIRSNLKELKSQNK